MATNVVVQPLEGHSLVGGKTKVHIIKTAKMQENFDGPVYLRAVFKIKFSELLLCNCQIRPYADKYGSLDVYGEISMIFF